MRYFGRFGDIAYMIKKKGPMEFVPVLAGVSLRPGQTVREATEIAVEAIKSGIPVDFQSTVSWPASSPTTKSVRLDSHEKCECFCDFMFKTLSRGGSVSIGPSSGGNGNG